MTTIHSNGIGVHHAIARALATANLAPTQAIFRVKRARVDLDRHGAVARAEVSVELLRPLPLVARSPAELRGLVNPDGCHPLMVWLPGSASPSCAPFFMDILAVSWSRWLQRSDGTLPPGCDPFGPVVGCTLVEARAFAAAENKRLPSPAELRAAWGPAPLPWGEVADPSCGRVGRPRYDVLPEGGLHPPTPTGLYDLGAWLWQWLQDGRVAGGRGAEGPASSNGEATGGASPAKLASAPSDATWPIGLRLVQDAVQDAAQDAAPHAT